MARLRVRFAAVLVLVLSTIGHGEAQTFPRTMTDGQGHRVQLQSRPVHIASVVLGVDENLLDLVDASRIVVMTQIATLADVSNIATRLPAGKTLVRDKWQVVVDAHPDLVLAATYTPTLATPLTSLRPDVILFGEDSLKAQEETAAMFRRADYQRVPAVKQGRAYAVPGKRITTTSHLIVHAVADVQALVAANRK